MTSSGPIALTGGAVIRTPLLSRGAASAAVLVLFTGLPANASEPLPPDWEKAVVEYVTAEMAALEAPGAAVAIVQGSGILFARGFGASEVNGKAITPETPFYIASVGKSLTALAVMQLVEAGRLSLDDRLGDLLSDVVPPESASAAISIENLLGHTSGWSERVGLVNRLEARDTSLENNARRIVETPLDHPTGGFEYSNANYDLLGRLIEVASGETYAGYMRRHVFQPLEMSHSFASEEETQAAGVATGHYPFFGIPKPRPIQFSRSSLPSAYLSSSAEDLGHFLIAILDDGRFGKGNVLSAVGTSALQQPLVRPNQWDGYAMGLWVYPLWSAGRMTEAASGFDEYRVPLILEHGGDHESYASSILLLPEYDYGIVVLLNINDESVPSRYHQVHLGIANILLGLPAEPSRAYEGPIDRYAKAIALAVVALFLVRVTVSVRRFQRLRKVPTERANTTLGVARHVALPLVVDVVLVGALWWLLANQAGVPLGLVRRSVPDIFLAAVVAGVMGLGWALARSVLGIRLLTR